MKDGIMVIVLEDSESKFAGETLKIEDIVNNKADLSKNGDVVLRGIDLGYLKEV